MKQINKLKINMDIYLKEIIYIKNYIKNNLYLFNYFIIENYILFVLYFSFFSAILCPFLSLWLTFSA